jgi:hypothetical protein
LSLPRGPDHRPPAPNFKQEAVPQFKFAIKHFTCAIRYVDQAFALETSFEGGKESVAAVSSLDQAYVAYYRVTIEHPTTRFRRRDTTQTLVWVPDLALNVGCTDICADCQST